MTVRIAIRTAHIPQAQADIKRLRAHADRPDCLDAADALEAAVRRAQAAQEKSRQ